MNYKSIKERAEIIFDIIEDKLNYGYDLGNTDLLDAYKASFSLKNRSVSLYKRAFRDSPLEFCISSVEAIYEEYCDELPGFKGLTWDEKEVLRELLDLIHGDPQRVSF
jgi:hypothetical protein